MSITLPIGECRLHWRLSIGGANHQSSIINHQSNRQSTIGNQSPIGTPIVNRQSAIRESALCTRQSAIVSVAPRRLRHDGMSPALSTGCRTGGNVARERSAPRRGLARLGASSSKGAAGPERGPPPAAEAPRGPGRRKTAAGTRLPGAAARAFPSGPRSHRDRLSASARFRVARRRGSAQEHWRAAPHVASRADRKRAPSRGERAAHTPDSRRSAARCGERALPARCAVQVRRRSALARLLGSRAARRR
jgi:hypothetical protein